MTTPFKGSGSSVYVTTPSHKKYKRFKKSCTLPSLSHKTLFYFFEGAISSKIIPC